MKHDELDRLLRDWAARHASDPAQRETLAARVRRELARPLDATASHDFVPAGPKRLPGIVIWPLCGLAAGLLVAVGLSVASRLWRGVILPDATAETASLSASEIRSATELFRRMEEVFPGDLRWIAETSGEVSLGLGPVSEAGISRAAPLLVRTVVLERKRGESSWRKVLAADVLSHSEELVEVSPGSKSAGRLLVWAYRLPDGNVAVDAKLDLTEPLGIDVELTNVLAPGRAARVFTTRTADGEFRVLQAVSPLSS